MTAKFTAPDAITRYRLVAVAAAGNNQFGSAESAITIQKPLLIIPSMAQSIRSGDQLAARAVIRNDTGHQENVRVALTLDSSLSSAKPTAVTLTLENGSAQTVDFPVLAGSPGSSHWQWVAQAPDLLRWSSGRHGDRAGRNDFTRGLSQRPPGKTTRSVFGGKSPVAGRSGRSERHFVEHSSNFVARSGRIAARVSLRLFGTANVGLGAVVSG